MSPARIWAALAVTVIFLPACNSVRGAAPDVKTIVSTGSKDGYYQKVCKALENTAEGRGLHIECRPSRGSQENIYRLEGNSNHEAQQERADFALVQSDVAHRAWQGEYPFDEPHPKIRLVAPLFTEKVHILVGPHEYLSSVGQLRREHRVWMGARDSGSRSSGMAVLRAAGLSLDEVLKTATTSLDARKAFALLRAERVRHLNSGPGEPPSGDTDVLLDAVIDTEIPKPFLKTTLGGLGIRMETVEVGEYGQITVLWGPGRSTTGGTDGQRRGWIPGRWSIRQAEAVKIRLNIRQVGRGMNVQNAFQQLQAGKLDALIQEGRLNPELVKSVLAERGYGMLSLGTVRQRRLYAIGPDVKTIHDLAGGRLWWPEDKGFEPTIKRAVCGNPCPKLVPQEMDLPIAKELLRLGALDAVMQTIATPNPAIAGSLNGRTEISLLGLDLPLMERLVADGSYVETSLQPKAYPSLKESIYAVGVQAYLVTGLPDGDHREPKVELMARILSENQDDIEKNLRKRLESDRAKNESYKGIPLEPYAMTLLGRPISSQLESVVHDSARDFLAFRSPNDVPLYASLRRGELAQICGIVGAILVLVAGTLFMKRRLGRRLTSWALFSLACAFVWLVGAICLQTVEGDLTQDFVNLIAAGTSLGETVLSHLQVPLSPPVPTTRDGQFIMKIFSWLGALLLGSYVLPYAKWVWHKRLEGMEGLAALGSGVVTKPPKAARKIRVLSPGGRSEGQSSVAS